jgi:hypothetical protein
MLTAFLAENGAAIKAALTASSFSRIWFYDEWSDKVLAVVESDWLSGCRKRALDALKSSLRLKYLCSFERKICRHFLFPPLHAVWMQEPTLV